ncbi:MAG TPA: hypothetical protein EYP24_03220 [bacterium (Candidatus Stahlbacteria)]|nr:hypothetical protein [Candidatus Stahlbacteria bacterium]
MIRRSVAGRKGQKEPGDAIAMIEFYSGHRERSYPVRIKKGRTWLELKVLESRLVEDSNGQRRRIFICQSEEGIERIEIEE